MYNGRSSRTRPRNTDSERIQPTRSAITEAGMRGCSASNARTRASYPSNAAARRGRSYTGGVERRTATRTGLRAKPNRRAIALMLSFSP